ncbi:15426_t:CDS:2 [Gigaspora margarita]|uniref:15426_t:CDS:1 n=1 Tax=Gigaspora margarita TaxID=4874 RepID=A0ABM8W0B8_GIGMA|nr:15426_t:CDS:2 [Gigaspora margarita]
MAHLSVSQNTRHLRKYGDPTKALCDYYEKQIRVLSRTINNLRSQKIVIQKESQHDFKIILAKSDHELKIRILDDESECNSQIRDLNNELSVLKNNYADLEKLYEDLQRRKDQEMEILQLYLANLEKKLRRKRKRERLCISIPGNKRGPKSCRQNSGSASLPTFHWEQLIPSIGTAHTQQFTLRTNVCLVSRSVHSQHQELTLSIKNSLHLVSGIVHRELLTLIYFRMFIDQPLFSSTFNHEEPMPSNEPNITPTFDFSSYLSDSFEIPHSDNHIFIPSQSTFIDQSSSFLSLACEEPMPDNDSSTINVPQDIT